MTDLELLRRHEPLLRFTEGELFFPCAVDDYVRQASLWKRDGRRQSRPLVELGALDLQQLAQEGEAEHTQALYMRYVQRPLNAREYQQWRMRPRRVRFHAPGRLARVPPWSRLLDSAFDLSLVIRGRVPGGTTAAAEIKYHELQLHDPRRVYYGRVVRAGAWTVLHYMFFYAMNDWRSTFHGANDHEADWEQMFVYLYQGEDGTLQPRWVACAAHDYYGDNLRRRWDDPLLVKAGQHPVIFAAAGSHACYFEQGEYLMGAAPRFLLPVKRAVGAVRHFWVDRLGQGTMEKVDRTVSALVDMPFVDYARGDGLTIGPGGKAGWTPILISDEVPWVEEYRGLWGLETRDPFGGERAPAGPKYNRDGSVRLSWYDPLGFAGLDKVVPPPQLPRTLENRQSVLGDQLQNLDKRITEQRQAVQTLALDEEALRATQYQSALHRQRAVALAAAEDELLALKQQQNSLAQTREAIEHYAERVHEGHTDPPQAHLRNVQHPDRTPAPRPVLQLWASLSGAIALLAVTALFVVVPAYWLFWAIVFGLSFATVEAAAEGRLLNFLLSVAVILAVISALILVREFWRLIIVIALVVAIALMVRDNVRELRGT